MGMTGYCVLGEHKNCTDSHRDNCVCDCPCHLTKHPKVRNAFALHAKQRRAGYMKDKRTPRAGQKNKQREYLDEDKEE